MLADVVNEKTEGPGSKAESTPPTLASDAMPIDQESNTTVDFDSEQDTYNPINWPMRKKVCTSLLYSLTSLGSVWASTAYVTLPLTSMNSGLSSFRSYHLSMFAS